jgi:chromate transporter
MHEGGGTGRPPSLLELLRVYLKISLLGFGGPNAHLALMLDEVVERRRWITREHFLQLVGVTNLLPGPNSSEVAIHIGYTQRGWRGALVTGLAFVVPTFFIVLALSWTYFRLGSLPRADALLWGVKPAVLAVIVWAGVRLARTAVTDSIMAILAAVGAAVAWIAGGWEAPAMLFGGFVAWWRWRASAPGGDASWPPSCRTGAVLALAPIGTAPVGTLATIFLTHLWIGSVLFGGGYMLVALLQPFAVERYAWVTPAQLLDGVAITQAIPGPISTLTTFVGYAAAGVPGAALATAGLYLPSFVAVLAVAPHLTRLRERPALQAALAGVSAVAAGAILGVAVGLAPVALPDAVAALLFVAALVLLARTELAAGWIVLAGLVVGVLRMVIA